MAEHKQTSDIKQLWTFGGLLALACAIFGYAVLPHMDPGKSSLAGQPAPDFALEVINSPTPGNRIGLADMRGKVVVLDFWASWCGPCRAQAPIIDRLSKQFESEPVRVVGINTSDQLRAATKFLKDAALSYPSVLDKDGAVARAYSAFELPTLVIVDPSGKISFRAARLVGEKEIADAVKEALKSVGGS